MDLTSTTNFVLSKGKSYEGSGTAGAGLQLGPISIFWLSNLAIKVFGIDHRSASRIKIVK